jgi:alpha-methylacyl-CoA racemase
VGDAAGALGLAFGITSALVDVRGGGVGRVVDAAIVDIVAMLGTLVQWIRAGGQIDGSEPSPFHDSPFYDTYACADGGFVTLAPIEPQFYAQLLSRLHLDDIDPKAQYDKSAWPALKTRMADLFRSQPRAYWCELLEGSDTCFAPVLSLAEAAEHPHHRDRGTYKTDANGAISVAAAPRFLPLS